MSELIYLGILLFVGSFYLFYRFLPSSYSMWVVGDGNVGIGTTTPNVSLSVSGSTIPVPLWTNNNGTLTFNSQYYVSSGTNTPSTILSTTEE